MTSDQLRPGFETNHRRPPLKWPNLIFLSMTPLAAALGLCLLWSELNWAHVILLLFFYSISNLAITVGYHRYFSHRSYKVQPFIEWIFALIGAGSWQGSALQWSTDHRRHHRKVDSHEDPYSVREGFWHAHLGWLLREDTHPHRELFPADLFSKPAVRFQHKYYLPLAVIFGFGLPTLVGWLCGFSAASSFLMGGILRVVLSQHSTFLINSAAHFFGQQPYTDSNSARDSFWLAFLTFGEGYHNFHHLFQSDYRNGVRWYHWDPSKWIIKGLSATGLASRLVRAPEKEILRARLEMQLKNAASRGANFERLIALRDRLQLAHTQFLAVRNEYRTEFQSAQIRAHQAYREKLAELELARAEFRGALNAWNAYVQSWCRLSPVRA